MRGLFGTLLPYVSRVITPCDADGLPAVEPHEFIEAQWETKAFVFAWLGWCTMLAIGDPAPRAIDPDNPRSWRKGDWS